MICQVWLCHAIAYLLCPINPSEQRPTLKAGQECYHHHRPSITPGASTSLGRCENAADKDQLTMIHFLGIRKRWSRQRLIPTTICSLLTLFHFNFVLFTRPSSYPLLNYLPSLLETLLLIVTLLTCALNILTQLLLEGEVRRPLFGHSRSLAPPLRRRFLRGAASPWNCESGGNQRGRSGK